MPEYNKGMAGSKQVRMINYLQLGRNLRRFAPKVEPKSSTYVFNPKGIYDFKQINPEIREALDEAFKGVEYPVMELSVKRSGTSKGLVVLKDGYDEFSQDTFLLNEGEKIEDFLPETDGCIKKMTYDKNGINELRKQYHLLDKFLCELTEKLKKPVLELWLKDRAKYSIGNVVLKDGDRVVLNGYFSKEKNKDSVEKYHFTNNSELMSGHSRGKDIYGKRYLRLPKELIKRLWILDSRAKEIMKKYFGIGCSPRSSNQIARNMDITGSRVREIVAECKAEMRDANTYSKDLRADLDNLGHILSDEERYKIYRDKSSIDINKAETKIIKYQQRFKP